VQLPVQLPCNPRVTTVQLPCVPVPAYPYWSGTLARASSTWRVGIGADHLISAARELVSKDLLASRFLQNRGTTRAPSPYSAFELQLAPRQPAADLSPVTRLRAWQGMPSWHLPTQCRHANARLAVMRQPSPYRASDPMIDYHGIADRRAFARALSLTTSLLRKSRARVAARTRARDAWRWSPVLPRQKPRSRGAGGKKCSHRIIVRVAEFRGSVPKNLNELADVQ
jgi:hypothetical protein